MQRLFLILLFVIVGITTKAQSDKDLYNSTFVELRNMAEGKQPVDFKKAVYMVENCYFNGEIDYKLFCKAIDYYTSMCRSFIKSNDLQYSETDKEKVSVYASVFSVMKDTIPIQKKDGSIINNLPFVYDFDDIYGSQDWSKMFVSKLLATKKGNCHSLPYLYKILVEELGETAYLSYAPNHIYIKQQCKSFGWYNTELTSGMFPIDSWLMASGYIHLSAIQQGVFMDTLSAKQSIGACMLDLAQGYEKKYGIEDGKFILYICKTVLKEHPNNINALLLKSETKMNLWKTENGKTKEEKQAEFHEIQGIYTKIHDLGYRAMPKEMYMDWLVSLKEEKHKYQNRKINFNIK
nr:hypothetical protein [uncultured Marinifilum sp.]